MTEIYNYLDHVKSDIKEYYDEFPIWSDNPEKLRETLNNECFTEDSVTGLNWDRINQEHKTITIDRQWNTSFGKDNHGFTKLKTKSSNRIITVPQSFLDMIN